MRKLFAVCAVLLFTSPGLQAQENLVAARDLYAAASYEDALAVLGRLDTPASQVSDWLAINQYRAFCLLALGRTAEAEQAIEAVVSADPLYRPADLDASPRLRSAFAGVRQRILPVVVQQEYGRAKAAFDREEFAAAAAAFDRVLVALGDPDLGAVADQPPLADLRTLANGFRELSARAAIPPPVQPATPEPPPAHVVVAPTPVPNQVYSATDSGVVPPVIVRQVLPPFQREPIALPGRPGVLEVIINEVGDVETALMRLSVTPRYDMQLLTAARTWKYQPAMVGGTPVKFRKHISVSLRP